MSKILNEDLIYTILSIVEEIPEGKVATYGQIARLMGRDRNSRLVGKVLSMAEYYGSYPCHRVVNHCGRTVPGWHEQRYLLEDEGVVFKDNTHVEITKYKWDC
ncbi:MAG: DNA methyltransferase [Clostridiales bacterium]|jgi:methylated-DNA-protein-cysteine methyltransferase-like protein|nr:DNA methyltransferase [Clostridiales bacterium]